jgi:hypothetical protein
MIQSAAIVAVGMAYRPASRRLQNTGLTVSQSVRRVSHTATTAVA